MSPIPTQEQLHLDTTSPSSLGKRQNSSKVFFMAQASLGLVIDIPAS